MTHRAVRTWSAFKSRPGHTLRRKRDDEGSYLGFGARSQLRGIGQPGFISVAGQARYHSFRFAELSRW